MTPEEKPASDKADAARQPDPKLLETAYLGSSAETKPAGQAPQSAAALGWVGRTLGRYQIVSVLGQGGMGVVLKGFDPVIERAVAIKLLPEDVAEDETALARFLAEAKAAGKLNDSHVVSIYEIGQEGQAHFLVMELIPGGSIAAALDLQGTYSVLDATRIMIDACKGIAAAHAVGLIHRDIKPANLMKAADGSTKVTDFGLAKSTSPRARATTQAGMVIGTPYFMSPEQFQGQPVDARTDVYALGATYYSLLTGKNPYQDSDSIVQVMYGHCQGEIPDPRQVNASVPTACAAIIARAMAKAPDERYQSVAELLADLEAVAATLSGERRIELPSQSGVRTMPMPVAPAMPAPTAARRRTRPLWIGALVGAAAVIVFAFGIWRWGLDPEKRQSIRGVIAVPQGEPIKVGVLHSMSGTMATSETVVVDATLFAIDEINRAGGLLGRPVKAIVADGRSDSAVFARQAERLITDEKVCTVFGCWTSASRKTVKPVFEEHDNLLIYPVQYEGLETSPSIVYMGACPNQQIIPAIQWAMGDLHKKRFFLVGSDYVFPRAANAIIKDHLRTLGVEVAGEAYLPLGSLDATAAIAAITRAKPDMILNTINGDSNVAFFHALRAAGIRSAETPCLSFSVGEQQLRSLNIADVEGDYLAWTYFQSLSIAENKTFVKQFLDKYPQRVITDPMEATYVGVKLWATAVTEAHSLEPKKICRAMRNLRMAAPDGPVRIDSDTQHCYKTPRVAQIDAEGDLNIVWSAKEPIEPEPYPSTRTAEKWGAFLNDLYKGWGKRWSAP